MLLYLLVSVLSMVTFSLVAMFVYGVCELSHGDGSTNYANFYEKMSSELFRFSLDKR